MLQWPESSMSKIIWKFENEFIVQLMKIQIVASSYGLSLNHLFSLQWPSDKFTIWSVSLKFDVSSKMRASAFAWACYHPYSNLAFLISYIHYLIRACNPWNHHRNAVPRESKLFIHISAIWKNVFIYVSSNRRI